jgi:hypothetical protein
VPVLESPELSSNPSPTKKKKKKKKAAAAWGGWKDSNQV